MNNGKAKELRARAYYYPHAVRQYVELNKRRREVARGAMEFIDTSTLVCRTPSYRRYKALKRDAKGLL